MPCRRGGPVEDPTNEGTCCAEKPRKKKHVLTLLRKCINAFPMPSGQSRTKEDLTESTHRGVQTEGVWSWTSACSQKNSTWAEACGPNASVSTPWRHIQHSCLREARWASHKISVLVSVSRFHKDSLNETVKECFDASAINSLLRAPTKIFALNPLPAANILLLCIDMCCGCTCMYLHISYYTSHTEVNYCCLDAFEKPLLQKTDVWYKDWESMSWPVSKRTINHEPLSKMPLSSLPKSVC